MSSALLFTAPWCSPCTSMKQTIARCGYDVEIVDISQNPKRANDFNIKSVPTLVDANDTARRFIGAMTGDAMSRWFRKQ